MFKLRLKLKIIGPDGWPWKFHKLPKHLRYFGWKKHNLLDTRHCFGFWFFHIHSTCPEITYYGTSLRILGLEKK